MQQLRSASSYLTDEVRGDARYALRGFVRRPALSLVLVLTFALGVGANVAMFQVYDAMIVAPLPFADAGRLVAVWHTLPGRDKARIGPGTYLDWRERAGTLESLALLNPTSLALTGDGDPVQLDGAEVSGNFFDVLRAAPLHGRPFDVRDESPGNGAVAMLSHGLWVQRYGADEATIGRTVELQGVSTEIVGVMPPSFVLEYAGTPEIWTVMKFGEAERQLRGTFHFAFGRLAAGATPADVRGELSGIFDEVVTDDNQAGWGVNIVSLKEEILGDARPTMTLLMGAGGLLLLIACANVASLTLARSAGRAPEFGLRVALGAGRPRLVRQVLVESLVLAAAGGALGLVVAGLGTSLVVASAPGGVPRLYAVDLTARTFAFACVVTLAAGALAGLLPALWQAGLGTAGAASNSGRRITRGKATASFLGLLVVCESAMVVLLLVAAALLFKSFYQVVTIDPGFDAGPGMVIGLDLPASRYADDAAVGAFTREFEERIRALPGVAAVGVTTHVPTRGGFQLFYEAEGHPVNDPAERKLARFEAVSPGYLPALGVRLVSGRLFDGSETADGARVLIINQTMAEQLWPGDTAVGKEILLGPTSFLVAGVIADVRHHDLGAEPEPQFYMADRQMGFRWATRDFLVRPAGDDAAALAGGVRAVLGELDPALPTAYLGVMEEVLGEAVAEPRFRLRLLTTLASLALVLGGVGIYGVVNYSASRRLREMAIRQSLGAGAGDVVARFVRSAVAPVLAGALVGVAGAALLTPRLAGLLFRVDVHDPTVFAGAAAFVVLIGAMASLPVARRVLSVRPAEVLSAE